MILTENFPNLKRYLIKQKPDLETFYNTIQKHKEPRNNKGLEHMKNIMKYNMCNCKPRKSKVRHEERGYLKK